MPPHTAGRHKTLPPNKRRTDLELRAGGGALEAPHDGRVLLRGPQAVLLRLGPWWFVDEKEEEKSYAGVGIKGEGKGGGGPLTSILGVKGCGRQTHRQVGPTVLHAFGRQMLIIPRPHQFRWVGGTPLFSRTSDDHLARVEDERRRLGLLDVHDHGGEPGYKHTKEAGGKKRGAGQRRQLWRGLA